MLGVAYGLRLTSVREIITFGGQITPVPNCSSWVLGVINLRGEVTPVVDYRVKFANRAQLYDEETIIIALRLKNDRMVAMVVDSIETITELDTTKIEKSPAVGTTLDLRYIEGLARFEGDMITLLEIETLTDVSEL